MDTIARRYGVRPSEIANGSLEDFLLDLMVACQGADNERKEAERAARRSRMKGRR